MWCTWCLVITRRRRVVGLRPCDSSYRLMSTICICIYVSFCFSFYTCLGTPHSYIDRVWGAYPLVFSFQIHLHQHEGRAESTSHHFSTAQTRTGDFDWQLAVLHRVLASTNSCFRFPQIISDYSSNEASLGFLADSSRCAFSKLCIVAVFPRALDLILKYVWWT